MTRVLHCIFVLANVATVHYHNVEQNGLPLETNRIIITCNYCIGQKFGERKVWWKCKKPIWQNKVWWKHYSTDNSSWIAKCLANKVWRFGKICQIHQTFLLLNFCPIWYQYLTTGINKNKSTVCYPKPTLIS